MSVTVDPAQYAAAAHPLESSAILTDTEGLDHGPLWIAAGDGAALPAYHAAPRDGRGSHPTVLVVQEIFGLHEYIKDIARRLAKRGYLAIAPDLYFRQGDATQIDDIDELRTRIVARVPDEQVLADLDASLQWADRHGGDAHRVGVIGFCWGGRIAWLYAAQQPRVRAAVAWYGRLSGPTDDLHPRHPVDVAAELKAPVLGLYGGQDASIPIADVEKMRKALATTRTVSQIHVYDDAPHAFHADYRPNYRRGPAIDGWERMLQWLKGHGV